MSENTQEEYWRVADISKIFSIGKSTVWKWTSDKKFPQPMKLSNKCTVWKKSEVLKAIDVMKSDHSKAVDQNSHEESLRHEVV